MNLTTNFSLAEMTRSDTALRLDLPNTPSQEQITNMQELAFNVLQKVRDHFAMVLR
jgi:zinc D-Ala-D-Ala carboxypeptidase